MYGEKRQERREMAETLQAAFLQDTSVVLIVVVVLAGCFVLSCVVGSCLNRIRKKQQREKKKELLRSVFQYLKPISNVDDLDIRRSPCGGFHVAYVNDKVFMTSQSEGAHTNGSSGSSSGSSSNGSVRSSISGDDDGDGGSDFDGSISSLSRSRSQGSSRRPPRRSGSKRRSTNQLEMEGLLDSSGKDSQKQNGKLSASV